MPELTFLIRWPDGTEESCYSPSTIIAAHLAAGQTYALPDFLSRCRAGLTGASARVEARHGYRCVRAEAQLAAIEARGARLGTTPGATVTCLALGAVLSTLQDEA